MHSPQNDSVSTPASDPDVLVNNVGTLYTRTHLEHRYAWGLAQGMKGARLVLE